MATKHKIFLLLIFLFSFLIHLAPMAVLNIPIPAGDSKGYSAPAELYWQTGSVVDETGKMTLYRSPGYPYFLVNCFRILRGSSLKGVVVIQALLFSALPIFLFWLMIRFYGFTIPQAYLLAILTSLDPFASGSLYFILKEGLAITMVPIFIMSFPVLLSRAGRLGIVLNGLGLALLKWFYPPFFVLDIFLLVVVWLLRDKQKMKIFLAVIFSLVFYAVGQFYFVKAGHLKNVDMKKSVLPSTMNRMSLIWQTVQYANWWLPHNTRGGSHLWLVKEEERRFKNRDTGENVDGILLREAMDITLSHPFRTAARILRINFWAWVETPGAIILTGDSIPGGKIIHLTLVFFRLIQLILAFLGIRSLQNHLMNLDFRYPLITITYLGLFIALLYPIPRYLSTVSPVIDAFAVLGFFYFFKKRKVPKRSFMN